MKHCSKLKGMIDIASAETNTNRLRLASDASVSTADRLEIENEKVPRIIYLLTFVASISGFMFGYDTGYISSVLVLIGSDLGRPLTIKQMELVSSVTSLGALIATSLISGYMSDYIGRKKTILFSDLLFFAGILGQCFATEISSMIGGRLIMGLGIGIGSFIAPLYISELAHANFRGRLVTVNCLAITFGQLVAYIVGYWFSTWNNGWRMIIVVGLLPCILQFSLVCYLPESPRFLLLAGNLAAAKHVFTEMYPNSSESLIDQYMEELDVVITFNLAKSKLKEFSKPSNQRALVIACGLQFIQQFVGFNAIMYYSSTIFQMVGFQNANLISCCIAMTNFLMTVVALYIIDRIGRRKMLLYSIPLLMVSQLLCSMSFDSLEGKSYWKFVLVAGLILFVAFYAIGLGNVPWQQSELFPTSFRSLGSSISTSCNWFGSMMVSVTFLSLLKSLSPPVTFFLFACNSLFSWVIVYLIYPELTNLQLEQVESILQDGFGIEESVNMFDQSRLKL